MRTILILSEKPTILDKVIGEEILLATKSLYLFQNLSDPRVKLIPLENEKQMPAEETWELLNKVNSILKGEVGKERSWVYEAGYHIEGTGLAQNCSDILSVMELITQIFTQNVIDEIILYPTVENLIECMLMEDISRQKGIKLKRHYGGIRNYLITRNFGFIYWLKYIRARLCVGKKYVALLKKAQKDAKKEEHSYQLGMIHTANSQKSISWKSTWLYGLKAEFETYKLLCLNAEIAAEHFRNKGVAADNMEEWLTKETVQSRGREYRKLIGKCIKAISKQFGFSYQDMNISKTVKYFIVIHLLWDVPKALEIDSICSDYFKANNYKVINSQGDSNTTETRAMYYATRGAQTVFFRREGLLLFDIPKYEPYQNMISIRFFCKGAERYENLLKQGWKGQAYFIGDIKYIPKFTEQYKNRQEIKEAPQKISVLWAPSYAVRGYTTYNTFQNNNLRILQRFQEKKWTLYVKFHPDQPEYQVKDLYAQYSNCDNICFIDKSESIYDWLEKVDMVITDKSLLVFDSISAGKPVMAICSPFHYSLLKAHAEGVQIFQSIEDMFEVLNKIEEDREFFLEWSKSTVIRQDTYFKGFIQERDAIKDMADILKRECGI